MLTKRYSFIGGQKVNCLMAVMKMGCKMTLKIGDCQSKTK